MGDWYSIGIALGVGAAFGTLFAGLLSATPLGRIAAIVLAGAAGALAGSRSTMPRSSSRVRSPDWPVAAAAVVVVSGALRRGGTRGGLALIVTGVALVLALLAFIPVVGYLVAVALPASPSGCAGPRPTGTPACALLPRTREPHPDRDRRADAVDVRAGRRRRLGPRARFPRLARKLPPRDLDVSLPDARLPLGSRHRRPS